MDIYRQPGSGLEPNESPLDRTLRFSMGLLLIALAYNGRIGPWGYLGFVPLLTGVVGICPVYGLLGLSTAGPPSVRP